MHYLVTIWDIDNNRHTTKCDSYDRAIVLADAAYANGAEYATVTNTQTGIELYDASGES